MDINFAKTVLQQLRDFERQMRPLREFEERHHLWALTQQFEPYRQFHEKLKDSAVARHIQDFIDASSVGVLTKRTFEQYFLGAAFPGLGLDSGVIRRALEPHITLAKLHREALGEEANPVFRVIEDAKKSLSRLWPTFSEIDFSQFKATENDAQDVNAAVASITQSASEQVSLQEALKSIILGIQAHQKPTVQFILLLLFFKVMDLLISGAVGAVLGHHYERLVLGDSPQAVKKALQEDARLALGSTQLLLEYRFVSAKVVIVRQNPRSLSPEFGRLSFGKVVKLLKKDKDFALILWTDAESGAEIQGWVFSRYLGKFS